MRQRSTRHKPVWALMPLLVLVVLLGACAERVTPSPAPQFVPVGESVLEAPEVDWELRITGAVSDPVVIEYRDLAARGLVSLADILKVCDCGDETLNTWEGIPFKDLLDEVGPSEAATAVILRGADGYWRKVPMGDLDQAMVALRRDGAWLADNPEEGPIRMVVPGHTAGYWMSQLVEIEVLE